MEHYFLKTEQVKKGENVLQIIQRKIKVKEINKCVIFKPIRLKYSICFEASLKCAHTVSS